LNPRKITSGKLMAHKLPELAASNYFERNVEKPACGPSPVFVGAFAKCKRSPRPPLPLCTVCATD
jgi:hypothetical protein